MRTTFRGLAGTVAGFMAVLGLVGPAQALVITHAKLSDGNVSISGNKAKKAADIYWLDDLNHPVSTSNNGGAFHFKTAIVPADCIARVSDGSTPDATVTIKRCTPDAGDEDTFFPATGQTACWSSSGASVACAGTGQDGDIRAGATLSYTSNADGTITDNNTGLVWEKKTNCAAPDPVNNPHCFRNLYTWADAFAYVDALNAASFAGHTDWRLPNVRELQSIVNFQFGFPSVSPVFNDCANGSCTCDPCNVGLDGFYWTSTTLTTVPHEAWKVIFNVGSVITDLKTFPFQVRAVRGGL